LITDDLTIEGNAQLYTGRIHVNGNIRASTTRAVNNPAVTSGTTIIDLIGAGVQTVDFANRGALLPIIELNTPEDASDIFDMANSGGRAGVAGIITTGTFSGTFELTNA